MPKTNPSRPGVCSGLALALSLILIGFAFWARTPEAAEFNRQTFERFYTAGMILMLGFYGLVCFGLAGAGVAAAIFAWIRKEVPVWLRWVGTVMSIIGPLLAISIISRG